MSESFKASCNAIHLGKGESKYTEYHVDINRPVDDRLVAQLSELEGVELAIKNSRYCVRFTIGGAFQTEAVKKAVVAHIHNFYKQNAA